MMLFLDNGNNACLCVPEDGCSFSAVTGDAKIDRYALGQKCSAITTNFTCSHSAATIDDSATYFLDNIEENCCLLSCNVFTILWLL